MALLTGLFIFNPEVDKFRLLNRSSTETECVLVEEEIVDLKLTYRYTGIGNNEKSEILKRQILTFFNSPDKDIRISADVLSQCISFIDDLYPSVLEHLKCENVYSTTYGTVIFDWEKDIDNVFSLEIGAKSIGYFIEACGTDIKQVDSWTLVESKKELLKDLSQFISV